MNDELLEKFQTARRYLRCAVNVYVPGLPAQQGYATGIYISDGERITIHVMFAGGADAYIDFYHVELI